jgi:hypothetical protein
MLHVYSFYLLVLFSVLFSIVLCQYVVILKLLFLIFGYDCIYFNNRVSNFVSFLCFAVFVLLILWPWYCPNVPYLCLLFVIALSYCCHEDIWL